MLPFLLDSYEPWTLTVKLKDWLDYFGTANMKSFLYYRWFDFESYARVLNKTLVQKLNLKNQITFVWKTSLDNTLYVCTTLYIIKSYSYNAYMSSS